LLANLEQYAEYCFLIDSYPEDTGGYWSKAVEYCTNTGVRGTTYLGLVYKRYF